MKKFKLSYLLFAVAALSLTACGDVADEITEIVFGRNFSPIEFEAKVRNRTNVELSWKATDGVSNYIIEVFENDSLQFANSPVQTITISPDKNPYTITGLQGETQYSFRIMAVSGDESRNSKWSSAYARTETEQILYAVAAEDIKAKEVTLRWPAGEAAATITLSPGGITYNITANDIAAGAATITGLTPETEYTATMKRDNGKTRGKITFTTGIDLAETDILVEEGADLGAAIKAAPAGYRLVLMPGEYGLHTEEADFGGSATITKNLAIKGLRPNEMPVIKGRIKVEANLDIDQVILDGTGTDGGQAFDFTAEGNINHLSITNSEIKNYTKGFFYINQATKINTITIDNCIISNIECSGGDFFDCRKGGYDVFNLTNSTVYNCASGRDVVRMDDSSSAIDATPNIKFDHCTFYNVGNGNANYRFFYVRFAGNKITFTNNIVVNFNNKRGFANQSSTDQDPTLDNNFYFNTANLISLADGNTEKVSWFDEKGTDIDPKFANPANGDFTVGETKVSDKKAGDPRWIK